MVAPRREPGQGLRPKQAVKACEATGVIKMGVSENDLLHGPFPDPLRELVHLSQEEGKVVRVSTARIDERIAVPGVVVLPEDPVRDTGIVRRVIQVEGNEAHGSIDRLLEEGHAPLDLREAGGEGFRHPLIPVHREEAAGLQGLMEHLEHLHLILG